MFGFVRRVEGIEVTRDGWDQSARFAHMGTQAGDRAVCRFGLRREVHDLKQNIAKLGSTWMAAIISSLDALLFFQVR